MEHCDFKTVYQRWRPKLAVFVQGYTGGDMMTAEDLTQEILLKVYSKYSSYNPRYSLSTWIYRIARNHCIDYFRTERRKPLPTPEESALSMQQSGTDLQKELEEQELRDRIRVYIDSLHPDDRSIAFLRYFEDLGPRDIAAIIRRPEGTIKYRIHRIKAGLKTFLEEQYGTEE